MIIQERIVDYLIGQVVSVDDSHFGFVQGMGTTEAIFALLHLQEKYLTSPLKYYLVGAEKARC